MEVTLRKAQGEEAPALYDLMTTDEKWTELNGPYFGYSRPTYEGFKASVFQRLVKGEDALGIDVDGRLVGTVTCYWEDEQTRWLEAGIVIFDSRLWGQGVGRQALVPWISQLFATLELERIGLTTWSGNPGMIHCGKRIGFQVEGVLRKVRYYQGHYFDSVKLGVTREEWSALYCGETKSADVFG